MDSKPGSHIKRTPEELQSKLSQICRPSCSRPDKRELTTTGASARATTCLICMEPCLSGCFRYFNFVQEAPRKPSQCMPIIEKLFSQRRDLPSNSYDQSRRIEACGRTMQRLKSQNLHTIFLSRGSQTYNWPRWACSVAKERATHARREVLIACRQIPGIWKIWRQQSSLTQKA